MAESVSVLECPATPERLEQCPETPDRLLNLKSPDSSASSDNECTINLRTRNTDSPPPNCAICLGRCKNKCFTDSCLHQFCFKCLLEWSKVKAECPLCKQPFNSIIHNVKSIDQFEEYLVGQPADTSPNIPSVPLPMPPLTHHPQRDPAHIMASRSASAVAAAVHSLYPHRFDVYLGDYPRFRSETNGFSTTVQVHPTDNETLQQIFVHRSLLVERLREEYPDGIIPSGTLGQLWRRYIYDRRLYAMPVVDITGRYRDCSARFFRDNPAQLHRIMAWINRDVVCLLRESEHHVSYVMNVISDLLTVFNMTSPEFRRRLQPYFRQRTGHFIHELLNFARSPYDMFGYDREVRYSPYYEEVVISSSSSSSSFSDSEDVIHVSGGGNAGTRTQGSRRSGRTEFTIQTRTNNSTFILTGAVGGNANSSTEASGGTTASTSRPGVITVSTAPVDSVHQPQILGESQVIQIDRNIMISSSSSDECEFVSERKAPHLRTPELVSLNSESDSDVVFISETKKTLSAETANGRPSRKRRPPKGVFVSSLSASQSPSSSTSSDSENEASNKVAEPKTDVAKPVARANGEDKTSDRIKAEDLESVVPEANSAGTNNNTSVKDEYNNGASTSSGLQSSESKISKSSGSKPSSSGISNVKKYYARPVRQVSSKWSRNMKSIYEESSSDTDDSSTEDDDYGKACKREICSDVDSDASSQVLSKLRSLAKHRKRKHERQRRQSTRNASSANSSSKKKKSKKSSARKKTSSNSKSKRRKVSPATSKTRTARQRGRKTRKRLSSVSSESSASCSASSSASSSAESGGWSSSSSE